MSNIPKNVEEYRQWWSENTDVPYGLCWCGCGQKTSVARQNHSKNGYVKGEPETYIVGHNRRIHKSRRYMTKEEYKKWWASNANVSYGYCWCGCGTFTAVADKSDSSRPNVKGEPTRYVRGHHLRSQFRPTYTVDNTTGCWLWQGSMADSGYPIQYVKGIGQVYAHRLYFEQHHGPIALRAHVHHKCKIRRCVNPAHLEEVTPSKHATLHGAPNKGKTLLSAEQEQHIVQFLRDNPKLKQTEVARRFGMKRSLVSAIWNRHNDEPRGRTSRVINADIERIRQLKDSGWSHAEIGSLYGVKGQHIGNVLAGRYVPPY